MGGKGWRVALALCAGLGAGGMVATTAASATPAHRGGLVVRWQETPYDPPNWILPFVGLPYYSVANLEDFQQLMYRPLYWFGRGSGPLLDPSLSLAGLPSTSSSGTTVTVTLKPYRWSNGRPLDAADVLFWMNMLRAEKQNWAGYVPGELPDNVRSVSAASGGSRTVTFVMRRAYNTTWLLYNELSQITPLPIAWDVDHLVSGRPAAPGSGGCSALRYDAAVARDCRRVWRFLSDDGGTSVHPKEAGDLRTYTSNPLWQIVDGPWHLTGFDPVSGEVEMEPNRSYSGPVKPTISKFVEVPSTTNDQYTQLRDGAVDVGLLPVSKALASKRSSSGPNPRAIARRFDAVLQPSWQVNYAVVNFDSNGDGGEAGRLFHQLYLRQVLQELVDQPSIIARVDNGYGTPTLGPVPAVPDNPFVSSAERSNPFPYGVKGAVAALRAHGWSIHPGGVDVCTAARRCGKGVKKGTKLSFTELVPGGFAPLAAQADIERTDASKAGVRLVLEIRPFNVVLGDATPCIVARPSCRWEMADWGGGWLYAPDYDPTGEYQFETGAGSNIGGYSSRVDDALIAATITSNRPGVFHRWENYLVGQLPVLWQPVPLAIVEVSRSLRGYQASVDGTLTPEEWRAVS